MIRIFVDSHLNNKDAVGLSAPQSHYLTHVMRLNEGDKIVCFNGKDGDWESFLGKQKKDWVLFPKKQIVSQKKRSECILCLSLIKRDPLSLVLQKATELGVTQIHLIQAERSNNERVNMDRLKVIVHEACEQCERNDVPDLFPPLPLSKVIDTVAKNTQIVCLSERGTIKGKTNKLPLAFFIGPEGGWSPKEQELFQKSSAFFWHLGTTILRAETAAITALALWQYRDEIKTLAI